MRRNLKYCPKQCKELAYFALVRSSVEYGCVVWDPHTNKEKDKIDRINRMVTNDWSLQQCHRHVNSTWLVDFRTAPREPTSNLDVHGLVAVPTILNIPADSRTRSNHNFKFRSIGNNSSPCRCLFFPRTISTWNLLPAKTVEATSVDVFKRRLLFLIG